MGRHTQTPYSPNSLTKPPQRDYDSPHPTAHRGPLRYGPRHVFRRKNIDDPEEDRGKGGPKAIWKAPQQVLRKFATETKTKSTFWNIKDFEQQFLQFVLELLLLVCEVRMRFLWEPTALFGIELIILPNDDAT